jgi:hypothetical protein
VIYTQNMFRLESAGTLEDVGGLRSCMHFSREAGLALGGYRAATRTVEVLGEAPGGRPANLCLDDVNVVVLGSGTQFEPP